MYINSFRLCICLFLFFACTSQEHDNGSGKDSAEPKIENIVIDSAINDSIDNILANASFMYSIYENETRSKMLGNKLNQKPDDINTRFSYARELLNNGDTQEAISQIEAILNLIPSLKNVNDQSKMFHEFLGVCYLRIGEQKNCQENHNDSSCIIPIDVKGIHNYKYGSQKAIEIYSRLLKIFPNDNQSRWLLNIAYMTLGKYPEDVPKAYLIPLSINKSDWAMNNVSTRLGIDGFGLSGGVIADDFDNDGFIDIVTSTWGTEGANVLL